MSQKKLLLISFLFGAMILTSMRFNAFGDIVTPIVSQSQMPLQVADSYVSFTLISVMEYLILVFALYLFLRSIVKSFGNPKRL